MTDTSQGAQGDNGKVLMLSTIAAGLAGGVGAFLRSRSKQSSEHQVLTRLIEDRKSELSELNSALDSRRKDLLDLMAVAGKNSRKALKELNISGSDLADVDWSKLSRRARKGLDQARREAIRHAPSDVNGRRSALVKTGEDASKAARSYGSKAADRLSKRLPGLLESVESDLAPRAKTLQNSVKGLASTGMASSRDIADTMLHRAEDYRPQVDDLASKARDAARHGIDDAKPFLEELAAKARDVARHGVEDARPRIGGVASKAREAALHGVDEAKPRLEDIAARARVAARHGADEAKPRFDDLSAKTRAVVSEVQDEFATEFRRAEEALSSLAHDVQERTSDAAHLVEDKSRASAKAVQQSGKDGISTIFWLGAAGAAVYFVLLNDEQREKVRHVAGLIFSEAKEIYADIQGEDGKF